MEHREGAPSSREVIKRRLTRHNVRRTMAYIDLSKENPDDGNILPLNEEKIQDLLESIRDKNIKPLFTTGAQHKPRRLNRNG